MNKREEKQDKFSAINRLLFDEYVLVHVDTAASGLKLPKNLLEQGAVTLKLSKLFRGKLVVEKDLISAELLFADAYFDCEIPMAAIWGVTSFNGRQTIWPESLPPELRKIFKDEFGALGSSASSDETIQTEAKDSKRGHLKRVK